MKAEIWKGQGPSEYGLNEGDVWAYRNGAIYKCIKGEAAQMHRRTPSEGEMFLSPAGNPYLLLKGEVIPIRRRVERLEEEVWVHQKVPYIFRNGTTWRVPIKGRVAKKPERKPRRFVAEGETRRFRDGYYKKINGKFVKLGAHLDGEAWLDIRSRYRNTNRYLGQIPIDRTAVHLGLLLRDINAALGLQGEGIGPLVDRMGNGHNHQLVDDMIQRFKRACLDHPEIADIAGDIQAGLEALRSFIEGIGKADPLTIGIVKGVFSYRRRRI